MEEIISIISNLGFPIGISIFLLVRIEGKMEKLTESIHELSNVISIMNASLTKDKSAL